MHIPNTLCKMLPLHLSISFTGYNNQFLHTISTCTNQPWHSPWGCHAGWASVGSLLGSAGRLGWDQQSGCHGDIESAGAQTLSIPGRTGNCFIYFIIITQCIGKSGNEKISRYCFDVLP